MKTLRLDTKSDKEKSIRIAADILNNGGIVAMPTETVYGLAASAFSDEAIKKVFEAKGRPQDNPLIVHIDTLDKLEDIAVQIPESAKKCAEAFWPGPFTMVLKKSDKVCKSVSAGLDTVAVRMPSDEIARELMKVSNLPLAAPSANTSGYPSPTSASHVINDLDGKIDAVLMGEDCEVGVESTVVALFGDKPRLLRPGYVTLEQLKKILPDIEVDKAVLSEPEKGKPVASPGMKYKHYSPKCEVYLVSGTAERYADYVNAANDGIAVCFSEDVPLLNGEYIVYGDGVKPETLAKNVFSVLRTLDDTGVKKAYFHSPDTSGVGLAVYNRLLRAAAFKTVMLGEKTVIGLTGPTGAGKSQLSLFFEKSGATVIDCDKLAREVETGECLSAIVNAFSEDVLSEGELDRSKLARIAFSSEENTEKLNATVLPFILKELKKRISLISQGMVIIDAPTLFESGADKLCGMTVAVTADKEIRLKRIKERDGISDESALLRMSAGKDDKFYLDRADFLLYNNGSISDLENKFSDIINSRR